MEITNGNASLSTIPMVPINSGIVPIVISSAVVLLKAIKTNAIITNTHALNVPVIFISLYAKYAAPS